ncbi:MAG: molybdenum cofactor guanylyltransferase [Spirochaetia bacterium]|nr:molybdenum cofactor guanylyltransferase [Spirochaetia bacterium]
MIGIVLSGGHSHRMGQDKGLMIHEGITWCERAAVLLADFCDSVLVSVREDQPGYATLPGIKLLIDRKASGPATALAQIHRLHPKEDLLVLASDMPLIQKQTLQSLLEARQDEPNMDVYMYETDGHLQPLCSVYAQTGLALLANAVLRGRLSFKDILPELGLHRILIPASPEFFPINSPGDLRLLRDL